VDRRYTGYREQRGVEVNGKKFNSLEQRVLGTIEARLGGKQTTFNNTDHHHINQKRQQKIYKQRGVNKQ